MWISALRLRNFRGFADSEDIRFARRTNVLVGPNNAGKSTIIRAIYSLQDTAAVTQEEIRIGEASAEFRIDVEDLNNGYVYEIQGFPRGLLDPPHIFGTIQRGQGFLLTAGAQPGQRGLLRIQKTCTPESQAQSWVTSGI